MDILYITKKTGLYVQKVFQDFFVPPICFFCRDFMQERTVFCPHCTGYIVPIVSTSISITKEYKIKVFAISAYKDPIRSLILAKGSWDIVASHKLGTLIWDMSYIKNVDFDYLIPIPLHFTRFASRGFNQAHEIARIISKKSKKSIVNILQRKKITKRQSALTYEKRAANIKDAFSLKDIRNISEYENKHLLIVDDLMTTGATIKAAAKILITLKPKSITAVVACRVI